MYNQNVFSENVIKIYYWLITYFANIWLINSETRAKKKGVGYCSAFEMVWKKTQHKTLMSKYVELRTSVFIKLSTSPPLWNTACVTLLRCCPCHGSRMSQISVLLLTHIWTLSLLSHSTQRLHISLLRTGAGISLEKSSSRLSWKLFESRLLQMIVCTHYNVHFYHQ